MVFSSTTYLYPSTFLSVVHSDSTFQYKHVVTNLQILHNSALAGPCPYTQFQVSQTNFALALILPREKIMGSLNIPTQLYPLPLPR